MEFRTKTLLLIALSVGAAAPTLASQQSQKVGFWKAKGSAIHNTNAGRVGIGTSNPAAKLDVAGAVAVNGAQVIDGSGQWVGDPTGLIGPPGVVSFATNNTRGGTDALLNNTAGYNGTAFGVNALRNNTSGASNTASGYQALYYNTTGFRNTAIGANALFANTIGTTNTAAGYAALGNNTTGNLNAACGCRALDSNTTGTANSGHGAHALCANTSGDDNTASGYRALGANSTGNRNIGIGYKAGNALTTGSDNIAIGNVGVAAEAATTRIGSVQTRAFIAGIRGVTTGNADGIAVLIDSNGQLGTVSSSRRFKEDIHDMGDATDKLLDLRPVVFRYRPEVQGGERPIEYGLIAEEVAEIFPDLVVYDDEGLPLTVKYHLLSSLLLNELQRHRRRENAEIAELRRRMDGMTDLQAEVASLGSQMAAMSRRLP